MKNEYSLYWLKLALRAKNVADGKFEACVFMGWHNISDNIREAHLESLSKLSGRYYAIAFYCLVRYSNSIKN